jgi:hypothetical protein
MFSDTSGYFRIGRTTSSKVERFDADTDNFLEERMETSPYTHCVFDSKIGFIGIAKKYALSPTTETVARRIQEVLSRTSPILENDIRVELSPIPNPDSFLRELLGAYKVKKFAATFHGPNPIDADELFQRPLAALLAEAGGDSGRAEIKGNDLNREVLEALTRSAAATGNDATARIRRQRGQRSVGIHLGGSIAGQTYDEEKHDPAQGFRGFDPYFPQSEGGECDKYKYIALANCRRISTPYTILTFIGVTPMRSGSCNPHWNEH